MTKLKILAIVPARGGSKSITLKNIKLINNKPLINYTIESALKSKIFDHIIISTDHKKIKKISSKYKKITIFDRSKRISSDSATTEAVVEDVLKKIKNQENYIPDWIFILEPTSPLRSVKTIKKAKNLIQKKKKINSLISIKNIGHDPAKLNKNKLNFIFKRTNNRKDRIPLYCETSTIYCVKNRYFMKSKKIVENNPLGFLIPKIECIDINDVEDFKIAEKILKN
ncbi:acylneuraminate cytidylyltransferase family protein [Candidatus Pelagibacter sp.]|nr:acylneuraminate cytidylyltransferase family protein [Candidatus Pelagibacter sp.]